MRVPRFSYRVFNVVSMAQTPKNPKRPASQSSQPAPLTRRGRARWQRERDRQRRVVIVAGSAIGLALLAVVVGILYDRVWVPSRPVAQVNGVTLSRGDYDTERRNELARRLGQTVQLLSLFGSQLGDQLAGQIPQLEGSVGTIRTDPVDDETVNGWIDRQLIIQNEFKATANDGEIAQQLVGDLAAAFPPPAPPVTNTGSLSATATLTGSTALTSTVAPTAAATATATATTASATGTPGATATPGGPTATTGPTETPSPTAIPTATPLPDAALQEQDRIINALYSAYLNTISNATSTKASLTFDDFKAALHDQYLRQVLTNKIEEQLIPEAGFTPKDEPSSVTVRHILIKVTVPISATETERAAAYEARKPEAQALLDQLRKGADFATLAHDKSEDLTSAGKGGELPAFDKDGKNDEGSAFDPTFVKAAMALKENQISDLVQTPFGWHIIQMVSRKVDSKEDQLKAARSKEFDDWLAKQHTAANIQRFPPVTPTPTPPPTGTPAPLPTAALGGEPTAVPTATATLTPTATLTATTIAAPATSGTATVLPTSGTAPPAQTTPAPSAVLPTPAGAAKP